MYLKSSRNSKTITLSRKAMWAALLAGSSVFAAGAAAAEAADAAGATNVNQVEDVIVTATRRSETLQKVPVAVSVLSGDTLRDQNRNSIPELITLIPAIDLRPQATSKDTGILLRGIGTITTSPGAEPSVSMVVDGVVLSRPGQMVSELIDVDRIEVLRGPQGTLFGKNASAGVINIITKSPTPDPSGFIEGSYYGGNEYRLSGAANGEIIKGLLSGRIAGATSSYEGNVRNVFTNSKLNSRDSEGFRGKLLFTPSDNLSVLLGADYVYTETTNNGSMFISTSNVRYPTGLVVDSATLPTILQSEGITPSFQNKKTSIDTNSGYKDAFAGGSAQIDYTLGDYAITAITGYRHWRSTQHGDLDQFSVLTPLTPTRQEDLGHVRSKEFTQELRLASPKGGFVDYVVGAYFFHAVNREDYRRDTTQLVSSRLVANYGFNQYGTTSENYSVFGEANINFTDKLRAIVGGRLVRDHLKFDTNRFATSAVAVPGVNPSFAAKGSTSVTDYADRLGVQYDISNDIHTYLTYSRGYKGPAYNVFFNMLARETNELKPETSDDFEFGIKSSLFDRRVQIDLSVFDDQISNFQANQPDIVAGTVVTRLINAGDVSSKGVEVGLVANVTENLTINADYAYVDAKIEKFNCPVGAAASCDVNGKPLPFAPKHKLAIRADFDAYSSARFDLRFSGNYTYQSKQQNSITQTPDTIAPSYGILNGTISITDRIYGWQGRILVRNILNKFYRSTYAESNGGVVAGLPRDYKRYFGISLRKDF